LGTHHRFSLLVRSVSAVARPSPVLGDWLPLRNSASPAGEAEQRGPLRRRFAVIQTPRSRRIRVTPATIDVVNTPDMSTRSAECLGCACQDRENGAAHKLLREAEASTVIGVLAAMCIVDPAGRVELVNLMREAIFDQRKRCVLRMRARCPHGGPYAVSQ
jgi:hypothetical protein